MKLNLTILADKMADYVTDQPLQSELFERPLEGALLYDPEQMLVSCYVYVISAQALATLAANQICGGSFVCVGRLATDVNQHDGEVIFVKEGHSLLYYHKMLQDIFMFYHHWELKILKLN